MSDFTLELRGRPTGGALVRVKAPGMTTNWFEVLAGEERSLEFQLPEPAASPRWPDPEPPPGVRERMQERYEQAILEHALSQGPRCKSCGNPEATHFRGINETSELVCQQCQAMALPWRP